MTIYLYIKTHKITGLKYLGQTKKDPFKYNGSGKDWLSHLAEHGDEHYTDILMECHSQEELSKWGRHYSQYYNIITAQDDYGNRIWANRIPETGGGGAHTPESRAKISASKTNPSAETRALLSKASKGRTHTDEARAKIRVARTGSTRPDETRAKIATAKKGNKAALGYKHTPEARARISAARRRKKGLDQL